MKQKKQRILLRGTITGDVRFLIMGNDGKVLLTSKEYETEEELKDALKDLESVVTDAAKTIVDQLPSTIAHK